MPFGFCLDRFYFDYTSEGEQDIIDVTNVGSLRLFVCIANHMWRNVWYIALILTVINGNSKSQFAID